MMPVGKSDVSTMLVQKSPLSRAILRGDLLIAFLVPNLII